MFIAHAPQNQTKLRRSGMSPRWGLKPDCMVAGYKHAAPLALHTWQTQVAALKRLQAETATELDLLLPAVLDRAFKGELR